MFDIGLERDAVDWAGYDARRAHPAQGERAVEGRGVPVAVRRAHAQALCATAPPVGAGHVGLDPDLVPCPAGDSMQSPRGDENEPGRIKVGLGLQPSLTLCRDIWSVLFAWHCHRTNGGPRPRHAQSFFARHVVTDQEPLGRPIPEGEIHTGHFAPQFFHRDV